MKLISVASINTLIRVGVTQPVYPFAYTELYFEKNGETFAAKNSNWRPFKEYLYFHLLI
jgi:hypothetical protein